MVSTISTAEYRSDPRGSARGSTADGEQWSSHPVATMALRTLAAVGPLLAAALVALGAREVVPVPAAIAPRLLWGVLVSAAATSTLFVVAAGLRRVLPLAALLRLSLAFPDQAPSRLRIARRTGSLQQSQARVSAAFVVHDADMRATDPATAIRRCLELVGALAHHDRITRGHCERVRAYCNLIGQQLGLDREDQERLQWAGLLHDVGKVGVPAKVLNKEGKLTPHEWEQIKQHPAIGARLTKPLESWLGEWVRGVGEHHERWDGDGYPAGIRGEQISLAARIIAVADAFDVMTAARSYKDPLSATAARAELVRCAGTQFDDDVVRAFVGVSIGKLRRIMGPSALLAQIPVLGPMFLAPTLGAAAPFASAAVAIGGFAVPATLAEDVPRTVTPISSTTGVPSSETTAGDPTERGAGETAAAATRERSDAGRPTSPGSPATDTSTDPSPTVTSPTIPDVGRDPTTTTTTTRPPGTTTTTLVPPVGVGLDPIVDPVNDGVVDPVVDIVDGVVPGVGVGDIVDDLRCLIPILGRCP